MNTDLLRFVDSISRDKNIEKEAVFGDLEAAMISAARRTFDQAEDVVVHLDRLTGEITATADGVPIDMKALGRIAAQTAKQVMIQKLREDERNSIFEEYSQRVGTVVTGTVTRSEPGGLTVNLGRGEGFMPRSEQIPGDAHHPGERIRGMILDVREEQHRVKIVLTQTHPDYIRKLFELEVPEVGERIIEIRVLAREAGYRTKVAVTSIDSKVDAVGACVGVRGSRIRNIVDELGGEKIDIVRWNESSQVLIMNALKPAEVRETFLCFELGRAAVIVDEDQLSLAIGKRGQNVRLAARLTGWDIDILTPAEYNKALDDMEKALKSIDGVADVVLDKLLAMGIVTLGDLELVGVSPLVTELELEEPLAKQIIELAGREAKRLAEEAAIAKAAAAAERAAAAEKAAKAAAEPSVDTDDEPETDAVAEDTPSTEVAADDESQEATPVAVDEASTADAEVNDTVADAVDTEADGGPEAAESTSEDALRAFEQDGAGEASDAPK